MITQAELDFVRAHDELMRSSAARARAVADYATADRDLRAAWAALSFGQQARVNDLLNPSAGAA